MKKKGNLSKEDEEKIKNILDTIESNPMSEEFKLPVPYKELNLFHYPKIVKKPMDLSKVRKRLLTRKYANKDQCFDELFLIWDNCQLFNIEDSDIHRHSVQLENITHDLVIQYFDVPYKPKKQWIPQNNTLKKSEVIMSPNKVFNSNNTDLSTFDEIKDNMITHTISPSSTSMIKNELISPNNGNLLDNELILEGDHVEYINVDQMLYIKKEMQKLSSIGLEQVNTIFKSSFSNF